jgi:imidazoleglycerol-phosphate dehydratase/histidinol-phosphatase
MKKALFIDRDGTLVVEPPVDFQVDSLEKLEYLPGVFRNLYFIRKQLDFDLIMVSNQDGMGRPQYPEEVFNLVQQKILTAFRNEGITFDGIHIDSSMSEDNLPTRKPGTAMLTAYMEGAFDLANSFVIGDRLTDIELARNLGAKAILIGEQDKQQEIDEAGLTEHSSFLAGDWSAIYAYLLRNRRRAQIVRETSETKIRIDLSLDGTNQYKISTGIGFFDHMLEQIARHGGIDLEVEVTGDLYIDEHHTIEDTGLALGEAFSQALFLLPMDESEAKVSMDLGGRSAMNWKAGFSREKIGDMPTEMFEHFFKSFSDSAKCNLHIEVEGKNEHHKAEAIFKAFAKVLQQAVKRNPWQSEIPSTKGSL